MKRYSSVALALLTAVALILLNPWTATVQADRKDDKKALKQTMRSWSKQLGVKCGFCHEKHGRKFNYKAGTHHKAIALVCADEFVEKLQLKNERPLDCASCHENKRHNILPRPEGKIAERMNAADSEKVKKEVAKFCKKAFVDHLRLKDGNAEINCATCHKGQETPANFFPEGVGNSADEHGEGGEHEHEGARGDDDDDDDDHGGARGDDDDDDDEGHEHRRMGGDDDDDDD